MQGIIFPPEDLLPHQKQIIYDPHRFKILVWHRRARKTSTAITEIINQAIQNVGVYWHIFPTYSTAKESVWVDPDMLFRILPRDFIAKRNENELSVTLKNNSVIRLKGGDDPDALRGAGPRGVVFDEFQKQKIEVWQTIEPALRAKDGWAWFIGTPAGKNHLYEFYNLGLGNKLAEWKSWMLKASDSKILSPAVLAEARKTAISEEFYNQEYECYWQEGVGQVFKGVRGVTTANYQKPISDHYYVCGVDLARVQDWTVVTVFDRAGNNQVYQDRFQLPWKEQIDRIVEISALYNGALCVVDQTGLGDPVIDSLGRRGVGVVPYHISQTSKRMMIEKLAIWIQQRKFKILPLEETIFELENFSYKLSNLGTIHYQAPDGLKYHDDIVISLALALSELNEIIKPTVETEPNWLQTYKQRAIQNMHGNDEEYFEQLSEWERL